MLSIKPRVSRGRQSLQFEHLVSESLDFAFEHQTLGFAERGYDALVNAEALEGCAVDFAAESEFGLGGGGHGCSEDMGFVLFERLDESGVVLASLEFSGEAEGFLAHGVCVWVDGLRGVDQRAADAEDLHSQADDDTAAVSEPGRVVLDHGLVEVHPFGVLQVATLVLHQCFSEGRANMGVEEHFLIVRFEPRWRKSFYYKC